MDRPRAAKILATAAACLAILVPLVGGVLASEHSHISNYISELGAVGTEWGGAISWGGFLPIGALTLAFLVVAAPAVHPRGAAAVGYWLLSCIGIAYVGAAFARCDLGCPASGSARQLVHNLFGLLEYFGGGLGLLLFSASYAAASRHRTVRALLFLAGVAALASLAGIATPTLSSWHGLIQRVGEVALFGSVVLIGWKLTPRAA